MERVALLRLPLPLPLLVLWLFAALATSLAGLFQATTVIPVALAVVLPVGGFLVCLAVSAALRRFVGALNLRALTLAQTARVLGGVFIPAQLQGTLPAGFAVPAGIGDLLVGATAPLIALLVVPRMPSRRWLFVVWSTLGILDLLVALTEGVLHSPTSLGVLAGTTTTAPLGSLPLSLFPTFLVPLALIMHVEALSIVLGSARATARA